MGEIMKKLELIKKPSPPKLRIYGAGGIGKTVFSATFQVEPKPKNKKSKGIPKLITTKRGK